jgi:hypothetical protein
MRRQPAQVTKVGGGLHRAAGKADQRVTGARQVASLVIGKPGAVGGAESYHSPIPWFDVLKIPALFFRRGYSAAGRETLSLAELRRYYARQWADATRPARLAAPRMHHPR